MTTPGPMPSAWLVFARRVIAHTTRRDSASNVPSAPAESPAHSGVFVTLHKHGRLRGCMGVLDGTLPLAEALRQAAISAAVHDPRFPPVAPGELPDVQVEVSILSPPQRMTSLDDLGFAQRPATPLPGVASLVRHAHRGADDAGTDRPGRATDRSRVPEELF